MMNKESAYNHPHGATLSRIGRILMDKAVTTKDDALSLVLSRVGDELTRYGEIGGARNIEELVKRCKLPQEKIMKLMKWAESQKDVLDKVKNPPDNPDMYKPGHEEEESYEEGTEMGKIGDVSVKQFGMGKGELGVQLTGKDGYIQLDKDDAKAVAERLIKWAESDGAEFGDYDESEEKDNQGFTDKEIKMAFGVLNDPRYKGGNYTGAVEVINKIAPGLADHPSVKKALQRTNEAVCSECNKPRFVAMPEEIQAQYEAVNEEKQKGIDGKVCWKGYKRMGTKKKGGKTVDNCVKM